MIASEDKKKKADQLTLQAEQIQSALSSLLLNNINVISDFSMESFFEKGNFGKPKPKMPKLIPESVEPSRDDAKYMVKYKREPNRKSQKYQPFLPDEPVRTDNKYYTSIPNEPSRSDEKYISPVPNEPNWSDVKYKLLISDEPMRSDYKYNSSLPNKPNRDDAKYNPKIGFFARLFTNKNRIKVEKDKIFEKDYSEWLQLINEITKTNDISFINDHNEWTELKTKVEQDIVNTFENDHRNWLNLKNHIEQESNREYQLDYDKWLKEVENQRQESESKFESDYSKWDSKHQKNVKLISEHENDMQKWSEEKDKFQKNKSRTNKEVRIFWESLKNSDVGGIHRYFSSVITRLDIPLNYARDFELEYFPDSKIAVLDYYLPSISDIPTLKKVNYIKTQDAFRELYHSDSYIKKLYDQIIYQIVLSLLYVVFTADLQFDFLESVVVNGKVSTIDRSTGQIITPHILSINIKKDSFLVLNLKHIDAKEWFKANKGVSAVNFSTATPIMPIIKMNKEDSRFIEGYEVAHDIDTSTNLAAMDWQDFENLIRELFEKEFNQTGGEVKITQASRDGGVDAVAFDPDPIRGGKIVIQAKRYTNVVGVSAVRDLYGTVMNEGATKGILVSTANYGSDAYEFAKNKPLTLLNGGNLLALLEKHGHKAKIDIREAKKYFAEVGNVSN